MRRFKRRGVFSIFELFENSTATKLQSNTALAGVAIASGEIKKKNNKCRKPAGILQRDHSPPQSMLRPCLSLL
jgi:hypothetical protein